MVFSSSKRMAADLELQATVRSTGISAAARRFELTLARRSLRFGTGSRRALLRPQRRLLGRSRRFSVQLLVTASARDGSRVTLHKDDPGDAVRARVAWIGVAVFLLAAAPAQAGVLYRQYRGRGGDQQLRSGLDGSSVPRGQLQDDGWGRDQVVHAGRRAPPGHATGDPARVRSHYAVIGESQMETIAATGFNASRPAFPSRRATGLRFRAPGPASGPAPPTRSATATTATQGRAPA